MKLMKHLYTLFKHLYVSQLSINININTINIYHNINIDTIHCLE